MGIVAALDFEKNLASHIGKFFPTILLNHFGMENERDNLPSENFDFVVKRKIQGSQ